MKCINNLIDDQYPQEEITHTRNVARAILINDKNEVCLIHLKCDDIFGHRDYYETPGGGVDNGETAEQAVIREIKEETGYQSKIITELGYVSDYYNLIHRHNMNYYYLLKATEKGKTSRNEYENKWFEEVGWYSLQDAIKFYENMNKEPIERLVKARELPVLKEAVKLLNLE